MSPRVMEPPAPPRPGGATCRIHTTAAGTLQHPSPAAHTSASSRPPRRRNFEDAHFPLGFLGRRENRVRLRESWRPVREDVAWSSTLQMPFTVGVHPLDSRLRSCDLRYEPPVSQGGQAQCPASYSPPARSLVTVSGRRTSRGHATRPPGAPPRGRWLGGLPSIRTRRPSPPARSRRRVLHSFEGRRRFASIPTSVSRRAAPRRAVVRRRAMVALPAGVHRPYHPPSA